MTTATGNPRHLLNRPFHQLIDGRLVDSAGTDPVIDPGTGQPIARAPMADGAQVDESVAAATRAFAAWRETPFAERAAAVERQADAVAARAQIVHIARH